MKGQSTRNLRLASVIGEESGSGRGEGPTRQGVLVPPAGSHLRFWYQVLTCVSLSCREAASSMRSWTLRYFCFWKLVSSLDSCWSLNAVRALRDFLGWKVEAGAPPRSEQSAQMSERPPSKAGSVIPASLDLQ